jgi:uncharacterized protein involved in outer membrane biogenesis
VNIVLWKKILIVTASVIVILVMTVYVFLSFFDFNKLKPVISRALKDATGRELTIAGDINVSFGFISTLIAEDISFQNAPWGSRPQLGTLKHLEVKVKLLPLILGNFKFTHLVITEPDILFEINPSGRSNFEFEIPGGYDETTLPVLFFNDVNIKNGHFTYRKGPTDKTYTVRLDRINAVIPGLDKSMQLDFKGALEDIPLSLKGTMGPILAWVDPGHPLPVDLKAEIGSTFFNVNGEVRDPVNFKNFSFAITAGGPSTLEITKMASVKDVPELGAFELEAKVIDSAPKTYQISSFKIAFADIDADGSLELNLSQKIPRVKANLSSQQWDLRPLMATSDKKETGKSEPEKSDAKRDRVFSRTPWPLDAQKVLNADIKIRNKKVLLPNLALNDVMIDIFLENGNLAVKPIKFIIGGSSADGQFKLNLQQAIPTLAVVINIDQLDLAPMLDQLGYRDTLEGKMDVDLNLSGRGGSLADQMAGLNGEVTISMVDGRTESKHLEKVEKYLGTGVLRMLDPFERKDPYMQVNCFFNRIEIEDGLADCKLLLDTDQTTIIGTGAIDLKTEKFNLGIKPFPKKGTGIDGVGKVSFSLKELSQPFGLGGTLANPHLVLDSSRTAWAIAKFGVALALGPVGIAAFFADVSVGKTDPCALAVKKAEQEIRELKDQQPENDNQTDEKVDPNKTATDPSETP